MGVMRSPLFSIDPAMFEPIQFMLRLTRDVDRKVFIPQKKWLYSMLILTSQKSSLKADDASPKKGTIFEYLPN